MSVASRDSGGLRPDLTQANRFLRALDPRAKFFTFQTFDDNEKRRDRALARIIHGTLAACASELISLQARGAGVFVTVNATDGAGRTNRNIVRPRAIWHECDDGADNLHFHFPPTIEVESSPGKRHSYWTVDGLTKDQFADLMATMVEKFGSDPNAADLARVLRVPGFWHQKEPENPRIVRLLSADLAETLGAHPVADVLAAFPVSRKPPRIVDVQRESAAPVDQPDAIDRASAYLLSAEPAVEGQGGDPHTIAVANRCMDFGVSPETTLQLMLEHWNDRCSPPWDGDDLERKVMSAAKSRTSPIGREIRDDVFDVVPDLRPEPLPLSELLGFPGEIELDRLIADPRDDILRNMIGPGEFGVLYGPSGSGKSFLALDLAHCVSHGAPWHGVKTRRAAVLYVMGEGMRGFKKRVAAVGKEKGEFSDWFAWLKPQVGLNRSELGAAGVQTVIDAVRALKAKTGAEHAFVIVDTLARAMAGDDENSAQEMMHFVEQRAGVVQRATGAAVMPVHHTNKAGSLRGSGALFGASECILKLDASEKIRSVYAEKVKDGPDHVTLFNFSLRPVTLGRDEDGLPVTSCVVEIGASDAQRKAEGVALEILTPAIERGVILSPKPKANNYAGRYVFDNQGKYDFSEADYMAALDTLLCGPLVAETYKVRGRDHLRVALRDSAIIDPF